MRAFVPSTFHKTPCGVIPQTCYLAQPCPADSSERRESAIYIATMAKTGIPIQMSDLARFYALWNCLWKSLMNHLPPSLSCWQLKLIVTHVASYAIPVITMETWTYPDARLQLNLDNKKASEKNTSDNNWQWRQVILRPEGPILTF